jgi:hypothetical protein
MFFVRVITALHQAEIDYAVIGGFALTLHGAVRGTVDIDLAIQFNEQDFLNIEKVLNQLGLESRLPVKAQQIYQFRKEYLSNRNLIAWNFYNPQKPIESVDILLSMSCSEIKIQKFKAFGLTIRVASIDDLIRMKLAAARPQDLADVDALQRLKARAP